MKKQIEMLVTRNLENLRYETLQSVDAAFREFSANPDDNLRLTIDATHGAVHAAPEKRKQHVSESADIPARLKRAAEKIQEVLNTCSTNT